MEGTLIGGNVNTDRLGSRKVQTWIWDRIGRMDKQHDALASKRPCGRVTRTLLESLVAAGWIQRTNLP